MYIFTILLCSLLHFLRGPKYFTDATFWAEDAVEFYNHARKNEIIEGLLVPYNGYFHLLPRSIAEIITLFPIESAAFIGALFSFLQLIPVFYFASSRSNGFLLTPLSKICMSILYTLAPGSLEVHATITNLQWWGPVIICTVLSCTKPTTRIQKFFDCLIVFVFSLSGVTALAVLPAALFLRVTKKIIIGNIHYILLLFGSLVQGLIFIFSQRQMNDSSILDYPSLFELYFQRTIFQPILGINGLRYLTNFWGDSISHIGITVFACTLTCFFFYYLYKYCHFFFLLQILTGTVFFLMFSQTITIPFSSFLFDATLGSRYFFPLSIAMLLSIVSLIFSSHEQVKSLGILLLFTVLTLGIPADFNNNRNFHNHTRPWSDEIKRKFRHIKPGESAEIKIAPDWTVIITKGDGA